MAATSEDTQPSGTTPGGIVGFLLARIAEDEEAARASAADAMSGWRWKHYPKDAFIEIQQLALDSRRRLRAECAAKRAILDAHGSEMIGLCQEDGRTFPCRTLEALMSVYADHPDYDESWRP